MSTHEAVEKAHEQEATERAHLRAQLKDARQLLARACLLLGLYREGLDSPSAHAMTDEVLADTQRFRDGR